MRISRLVFVTALLLGTTPLVGAAVAQDPYDPNDACFGMTHFPEDPIDGAPSIITVGVVVPVEYAGGDFMFDLTGASGDQVGMGTIGPDGVGFADAPLYQYGPHEVTGGTITTPGMGPLDLDLSGLGPIEVNDAEPVCDSTVLVAAAPTTTSPPATTTTTTSTTTTTTTMPATSTDTSEGPTDTTVVTVTTVPTTSAPDDEGGMFPWGPVLIVGGLLVAGGGVVVARGGKKKDCDQERENLAAAQRRLGQINETLEEALKDLAEHEAEITEYESDLAGYKKAKDGGSTVDNGIRYYQYGGGRIADFEVDAQIEYYESLLNIAREAKATAEARVTEWHGKFDKADMEVRQAQEALAKCLGESTAPTPPPKPAEPETPGPTTPGGPSGPAVTTSPQEEFKRKGCEDGATFMTPSKEHKVETLHQVVDFAVITEIMEGTQRKVGEAKAMSLGLGEAANALDLLGKGLGARGAGQSIAKGFGGMSSGEYVMGGLGLVKGTAEGTMASGLTDVSIPTSPPEAVVEVVKGAANLGKFVSDKVGQWLTDNQVYEVHLTLFQQKIVATPFDQWRCDKTKWKCQTVWQYSVGQLRKKGNPNKKTFRTLSDQGKHAMQREISSLGRIAQNEITRSLQARADFDAKHQPSSCG